MSQPKHTPGPWKVGYQFDTRCEPGSHPDGSVVSDVAFFIDVPADQIPHANPLANARLIAAAPEMLEALEKALNEIEPGTVSADFVRDQIEKAIAKALGGDV